MISSSVDPIRPSIRASAAALLVAPALAATPILAAAEEFTPHFSGGFSAEIQSDSVVSSDDPTAEFTDSYATVEVEATAHIAPLFSATAALTFEPVLDATDDRAFDDHGLYVAELYAQYGDETYLRGGKISPAFAIGWDAAPGLYGADFAEDYELSEMIGFAAGTPLPFGDGAHRLSAAVFFVDTTRLSDSIFQDRGRTTKSDGGVGNTETLENVAFSLDGAVMETGYSLGYRRLARGASETEDEHGVSFALTRSFALGGGEASFLAEGVYLVDAGGAPGDTVYGVAGVSYAYGDFTASAAYTIRDADAVQADHLATASLEYDVGYGFSLGVGYAYDEQSDVGSHTVGAVAGYAYEF